MSRYVVQLRPGNDREKMLERVQEAYGCDNRAEAIDVALRAALDYKAVLESARAEARAVAAELNEETEFFNVNVETGVSRDNRRF